MILSASNISKHFGEVKAVDNISFQLDKGEVVGFVGANGAGKTTAINMLLGFTQPTQGIAKVFSKVVTPQNAHLSHTKIGYASGDMEIPERLTGKQYLDFVQRQNTGNTVDTYKTLIKRFQPQLDKRIKNLSRGNKQKIALIGAFMTKPELLILDEPTSGLDPAMQETFLDLVREHKAAGGTTFMSSHYLQEVADVCDRVILMKNGKLVQDVSTKKLLSENGKTVRILTGYHRTQPVKGAESVEQVTIGKNTELSFVYKGGVEELQRWIASIKQLKDVEVTEYNLEAAFHDLYSNEEESV